MEKGKRKKAERNGNPRTPNTVLEKKLAFSSLIEQMEAGIELGRTV